MIMMLEAHEELAPDFRFELENMFWNVDRGVGLRPCCECCGKKGVKKDLPEYVTMFVYVPVESSAGRPLRKRRWCGGRRQTMVNSMRCRSLDSAKVRA